MDPALPGLMASNERAASQPSLSTGRHSPFSRGAGRPSTPAFGSSLLGELRVGLREGPAGGSRHDQDAEEALADPDGHDQDRVRLGGLLRVGRLRLSEAPVVGQVGRPEAVLR